MSEIVADLYVRVSTDEQAKNGVSKDDQIQKGKALISGRADLTLGKVIVDDCSTKTPMWKRKGGKHLLNRLNTGQSRAVVVTKMDRAFRTTTEIIETVTKWGDEGVSFICTDQNFPIDTSNSMGRFILTMFAGLAQFERDQVGERTKSALGHIKAHLDEHGEYTSKKSGKTITCLGNPKSRGGTKESMAEARMKKTEKADQFAVQIYPSVCEVIRDLHLRDEKTTYDGIAHELNKRKIRTRTHRAWTAASFQRMWLRIAGHRMQLTTDRYRTDKDYCLSLPPVPLPDQESV